MGMHRIDSPYKKDNILDSTSIGKPHATFSKENFSY